MANDIENTADEPPGRGKTLRKLWAPKLVRYAAVIVGAVAAYDGFSSQFDTPKLGEMLGMSGSLLPWWGWVLVLQAIFVYALFEYVRRIQIPAPPPAYDDSELRSDITALKTLAEATVTALEARVDRQIEAMRADAAITNELAKVNEASLAATLVVLKELRADLDDLSGELRRAASQAQKDQDVFQGRMEIWVRNLQRRLQYGLVAVDHALAAVLDRENMKRLLVQIEEVRDELSGPTDRQEPIGDMNVWLAKYGGWYRNVEAWARLGEKYRIGTIKRVFAILDSDYEGDWKATDDLFPNSKAVHKYKQFRIYSRNFFAELEAVERCVEQAAFVHPTKRPQPVLDEEGDDDQPYVPPPPSQV